MVKIPNSLPRSSIGRSIPAPFRRPSIDLDKVVREWKWVLPEKIQEGDIIPDMGLIKSVKVSFDIAVIIGATGTKWFDTDIQIWAFSSKT